MCSSVLASAFAKRQNAEALDGSTSRSFVRRAGRFYGHYHPALIELHPVLDPDAELAAAIAAADKVAESLQKGT